MNIIDLQDYIFSEDRIELRKEIINIFLAEMPGTGKNEYTSKYKYIVKKTGDFEVYLSRPATLNNGFDFTLNVSNINFNPKGKATSRPTHKNILEDLFSKKQEDLMLYRSLRIEIDKIFQCKMSKNVIFDFKSGINSEILLECIKWLFIEQDVTYWNYSGRTMLFDKICEI